MELPVTLHDKIIKLWNIRDSHKITTLQGHFDTIYSVNFSPDGELLGSGGGYNTVKIWNLENGNNIFTKQEHPKPCFDGQLCIFHVAVIKFSPDGTMLASGSDDGTIKLWNATDGNEIMTLQDQGYLAPVQSLDFSPNGKLLASGSRDGTIKLWNARDGSEISTLTHSDAYVVMSLNFSLDGKMLASGSADKTIKLWNLDLDDLLTHGCKWLYGYLKNNPNISDKDSTLCDEVLKSEPELRTP